jgi:hypothetical protein
MKDELQLLGEVEDILRSMPSFETLRTQTAEGLDWLGRANNAIERWDGIKGVLFRRFIEQINHRPETKTAFANMVSMLHQARHDLRMATIGPVNVAVGSGMPFDYFDVVRKIIETARKDVLFADPYLDADFVSRYLGHIASGVSVRLLAREKLLTLVPAVKLFASQHGLKIELRSVSGFHDRYVFIDRSQGFHSGASFKDGAIKSPTTLNQVTDAFAVILQTYDALWNAGKIEYS